jgi:hypothetical protein
MFTPQLLGTAVTVCGLLAALAALQARQMHRRGTACNVWAPLLRHLRRGYAIWLLYGPSACSIPLIVDTTDLLCAGLTLIVALSLRGSLITHPPGTATRDP